jgi:hypothetical protein
MDPPAPPESSLPAAPTGPLADLILARLLPATASVPPKKLRDDIGSLFRPAPSPETVGGTLAALRAAGLVTPNGQQLTDAGRARARAYLGVTELPPKANWRTVKAKYLVPKALGLTAPADAETCGDAKRLAPLLLKRRLGLPVGTGSGLGAVLEAIACRELGYPDHSKLKELLPHLLGKAIGSDKPLDVNSAVNVVPRVLLDAPKGGLEGLRAVALAGLTGVITRRPMADPEPFDLEAFAHTVVAVARRSPTGRFGDNKVFINHVWRQVADEPRFTPLGPTGFKDKLVEANRENLLTLSRADLVQVMDPADVRESETAHLNAVFHFILLEKQ